MKPTAPLRYNFSVFARHSAVAYRFLVRPMKRLSIVLVSALTALSLHAEPARTKADLAAFRQIAYQPLPAGTWKMVKVGANGQTLALPFGKSHYAALALPPGRGSVELRMQTPLLPPVKSLLACVTFLNESFHITHTADHNQAYIPKPGAFRPLENPLLEMRVDKRASDRYMIVHTNEKIVGQKLHYDLGNRGSTIIVTGTFAYSAQNPRSVDVIALPKGSIRIKFFADPTK